MCDHTDVDTCVICLPGSLLLTAPYSWKCGVSEKQHQSFSTELCSKTSVWTWLQPYVSHNFWVNWPEVDAWPEEAP